MAPAPNAAAGPSKPAGAAGGTAQVTALQKDIFLKLKNAKEQGMTAKHIEDSLPGTKGKDVVNSLVGLIKHNLIYSTRSTDGNVVFYYKDPKLANIKQANTPEMNACLTYIRDANSQGITSKAIRNKIGPNEITVPVIRKAIEALEKSGQIKSFKSIHQPTIPLFIAAEFKPDPELLGGVWYDGNKEYDAALVDGICKYLLARVREASQPRKASRGDKKHREDAIFTIARTPKYYTPTKLLKLVRKSNITAAALSLKNVMECMRVLELDGHVEVIKPVAGIDEDEDVMFEVEDDDDRPRKKRKGGDSDDDDDDEREAKKEREREKKREKLAAQKRKEKEKKRKEKEAKKAKEKEKKKKRKEKKRKKEKEKDKKRKKKGDDSDDDDSGSGSDNDSDALVDINDTESSKKKDKKRKRRASTASSSSSSSSSSDSDSDSDSDSSSESDSASSIDSDDIDDADFDTSKSKRKARIVNLDLAQDAAFGAADVTSLDDPHVVYRAISKYRLPLGQDQVPCGKCPQFTFCEEKGPVNPDDCPYFDDWLLDINGGWDEEGRKRFKPMEEEEMAGDEANGVNGINGDIYGVNGAGMEADQDDAEETLDDEAN